MIKPLLHEDPQHIGVHRLVARLGSGGMGTVDLARSPGGRTVALKTVHAHIAADATFRTRFRLETDAARVIGGLHGAQVVDADPLAEVPWLATEYVLGPPLDDAVSLSGALPEPTVRAVGAALCGALGQLHRSDVVHRDLKPANIVLTSEGPRIIDFGIARPEHGLTLTTTGQIPVTPGYGAPEQALGHRVGPAADVFSLSAVLVYAASGQRAFAGSQVAAVQYEVVHGQPQLSYIPEPLRALIAPCLAKEPGLRPGPTQIAHAFTPPRRANRVWRHGDLASLIDRYETEARRLLPAGSPPAPMGQARRRFLTALATGGAVLAVGGGTAAWRLKDD
ncbi:serine/threonine-protein kinase [Streptomyces sp. NPDC005181]|uniref:serine/threonine-protein kinase n=1 Tax=Streptomyces sp. NPDC005181 TaxID=3156869 RepID=UPI0033BF1659